MSVDGITKKPAPTPDPKRYSATEPVNGSVLTRLAEGGDTASAGETAVIQVSSIETEQDVVSAVRKRETEFLAQVNNLAEQRNAGTALTGEVLANDRALAKQARKLQELVDEGKGEKPRADEIKQEISRLLEERAGLTERAKEFNAGPRAQEISFGSKSRVVKIEELKVTAISSEKLGSSSAEIAGSLKRLTDESRSLQREQRQELRAVRDELAEAVGAVRVQVEGITGNAIKGFEEAQEITSQIADGVRTGGLPLLEQSLAGQALNTTKADLMKLFAGQIF